MNFFKNIKRKLTKGYKIFRSGGFRAVRCELKYLRYHVYEKQKYQKWLELNKLTDEKRALIRLEIANLTRKPLISVVMPVYNVEEKWLRLCIESVLNQLYENWEFCIADDASPSPHVRQILEHYAKKDKRIKIVFREKNGHISAASNSALKLATGEFCVLLDHDDELSEDALFYVAKELNDFPETAMIYSDEDLIDESGRRYAPKFKPDFSIDFLYSLNLITHLSAYKTEILRKINGFRLGAEGSQDYDLALRFIEQISEKRIRHIPRVLYHWRVIKGSVAYSSDEKPYAHSRARDAISAHLERCGKKATVTQTTFNLHRVQYQLPENLLKVSLILSDGLNDEIESDYQNIEIIKSDSEAAESLNRAAGKSSGEILCFLNANLKPLSKDWLSELVRFAIQTEIGAVGAKILDTDETILHGGLIINKKKIISPAHHGFPLRSDGNFLRLKLINNFSAVSISCLCVKKSLFEEIGGFDAKNLPNCFFDADFCLKLREKNYRVVFTPYTELKRIKKNKRLNFEKNPTDSETKYFEKRWLEKFESDPFYNPNFLTDAANFSIDLSQNNPS